MTSDSTWGTSLAGRSQCTVAEGEREEWDFFHLPKISQWPCVVACSVDFIHDSLQNPFSFTFTLFQSLPSSHNLLYLFHPQSPILDSRGFWHFRWSHTEHIGLVSKYGYGKLVWGLIDKKGTRISSHIHYPQIRMLSRNKGSLLSLNEHFLMKTFKTFTACGF